MEGDHEAIIPKEIFLRVQEEPVRRRVVNTGANGRKRTYSCNHCFSQLIVCGECGEIFRRIHRNNRGCKSVVRRCISRQTTDLTEFDEALVKRRVQKITVRPDRYTVELKSGLSVDIEG